MYSTTLREDGHIELMGLSSDEKPMNLRNGSIFIEMDTSKVFAFDEANKTWLPL